MTVQPLCGELDRIATKGLEQNIKYSMSMFA